MAKYDEIYVRTVIKIQGYIKMITICTNIDYIYNIPRDYSFLKYATKTNYNKVQGIFVGREKATCILNIK